MFENKINVSPFPKHFYDIPLNKDVKKLVSMMDFPQKCIFISKFNMRNNHLLPREKTQNIRVVFFLLFINILCIYRICIFKINHVNTKRIEFDFLTLSTAINYTTFSILTTIIFGLDISLHYNYSCLLILKIQRVHGYLSLNGKFQRFVFWSWIFIIILFVFTITSMSCNHATSNIIYIKDAIADGIADFVCITLDCKMIIGGRIIILLKMYIDIWIKDVLREKGDESNDRCLKLFEIYRDILEAYQLCHKIYQILVSWIEFH